MHAHVRSFATYITVAITVSFAVISATILLPAASRNPEDTFVPPDLGQWKYAITPGAPIIIGDDPTGRGNVRCTLGFFLEDDRHKVFAVTAGHCATRNGAPTYVVGAPFGLITASDGLLDYATVPVNDNYVVHPWHTAVATPERGDKMCKWGSTTGYTCGKVTAPLASQIVTDVRTDAGDSGGPGQSPDGHTLYGLFSYNLFLPRIYAPSTFISAVHIIEDINSAGAPGVSGKVHLLTTDRIPEKSQWHSIGR